MKKVFNENQQKVATIKMLLFGDFKAPDISHFHPSEEIVKMVKEADISVLNFEAPISGYGKGIAKSGPSISQDTQVPNVLVEMGFNVILLANNHMMDFGEEGCKATMDAFKDVVTVGAGSSEEAYCVKVVEKDGKRIGFLALCQYEFGILESKQEKGCGVAWVLSLDVEDVIKKARQEVDYLIVCPHAGVEHTKTPLPEWRHLYKKYIDWGADAVVASHPHRVQGCEYYNDKPIFYSLGNFFWGTVYDYPGWTEGLAVEIALNDSVEIKTYSTSFDSDGNVKLAPNQDVMQPLNYLLSTENEYMDYINSLARTHWKGLMYGLLRGVSGVSFKVGFKFFLRLFTHMLLGHSDRQYALNIVRNESYRWLMQRSLMLKSK